MNPRPELQSRNRPLLEQYECEGVLRISGLFSLPEVAALRLELDRYMQEELASKPADARTLEPDGKTVRNLWRLEIHHPGLLPMLEKPEILV